MFWDGPFNESVQISIDSFAKFYDVNMWMYNDIPYSNCNHMDASIVMDNNELSPIVKSDIFRLKLIYKFGGWYTDCDTFCKKQLPDGDKILVEMKSGVISNGTFKLPSGTPELDLEFQLKIPGFIQFMNNVGTIDGFSSNDMCNQDINSDAIVYHLLKSNSEETLTKMKLLRDANS